MEWEREVGSKMKEGMRGVISLYRTYTRVLTRGFAVDFRYLDDEGEKGLDLGIRMMA